MRHLSALPCVLLLVGCGGTVVFGEGGGGDGGAGQGGAGAVTVGPTTGVAGTGTASSSGGGSSSSISSGNAGGGPPSSVVTSTGTGQDLCGGRNYADCLGAGATCVPVFDDFCCPSCFPGGCADCTDLQFVTCVARDPIEPEGSCAGAPCGFIPGWACQGGTPACADGCFGEPGCVEKVACQGDACSVICEGVRPDACDAAACNAPPPACPGGSIPEVVGACWTGACIPAWVCAPPAL